MGQIIVLVFHVDVEAEHFAVDQAQRNIRRLHEAELDADVVEAMAQTLKRVTLVKRHPRPVVGDKGQQHHGRVQDAIVLDMAQ